MKNCTSLLGCWAVLAMASAAASGVSLFVTGDLGNHTGVAPPGTLNSGDTLNATFLYNMAGRGSIEGEINASNTGGVFRLSFTNLYFQALDWSPTGETTVRLEMTQIFSGLPGNYVTGQAIDGMTNSSSDGCVVVANTTLDYGFSNALLPVVFFGSPPGGPHTFSEGPTFAGATVTHTTFVVKMQLDLTIFGYGTILMPGSFESETIPAPGRCPLTGMHGGVGGWQGWGSLLTAHPINVILYALAHAITFSIHPDRRRISAIVV